MNPSCPAGNFYSIAQTQCVACSSNCKTCITTAIKCTSCKTSTYLLNEVCYTKCPDGTFGYSPDSICATECPIRFYGDISDNLCKACPSSCKTCAKNLSNFIDCYSCNNDFFYDSQTKNCSLNCVSPRVGDMTTMSCISNCQPGFFLYTGSNTCSKCSPLCKTCESSQSSCTSCNQNTFLYNNTCVSACPVGRVQNETIWTCQGRNL